MNTGTPLPSLQALSDPDDRRLLADLRLMAARRQIATFRAIADELERCLESWSEDRSSGAVGAQLLEEVAALGCRALEAAAATRTEQSGVHRLPFSDRRAVRAIGLGSFEAPWASPSPRR